MYSIAYILALLRTIDEKRFLISPIPPTRDFVK